MKRTLAGIAAAAAVTAGLAGCGTSSASTAQNALIQKDANLYQIDQIERTWHEAASTHNVNLMMTVFAPGAVLNIGGKSYTGKSQIRNFFQEYNTSFQPTTDWVADTPSFKMRTTVNGDKGTLYFECDYIDVKTGKVTDVVGVDHDVQKINGKWLVVSSVASTPTLSR
ncbi:MAG TPA: nuclear transport factor 2 family protein [Mycobacteriales bacterium]|nr:nuclear transport factor 2 family protein [Mycobacteriales bacterium]